VNATPLPPQVVCYKNLHLGILEDLDATFGLNSPAFMPTQAGTYDPLAAAIRDGGRRVLLHIHARLHAATHEKAEHQTAIKD